MWLGWPYSWSTEATKPTEKGDPGQKTESIEMPSLKQKGSAG